MLHLDTLTCVDPDATSIYDISSTPYDVDRIDPYDEALIVHDEDHLDPDGTSIIDIRGMAYDVGFLDLEATSIYVRDPSPRVARTTGPTSQPEATAARRPAMS
jgi:hypothetical protein